MAKVKLTIFPEPREIPDDEIPGLRSQGLIEDEPGPASAPAKLAPDADIVAAPVLKDAPKEETK